MNTVLLAFSGGLDTTYCARLLAVDYGMAVHTVIVDTGGFSPADLEAIAKRARQCSVASHATLDRTQALFDSVLRWCIAGNVLKNNGYPLSVSAERVVQAIAIAEHAKAIGATHIAHGSTGAGNDQIRFDVIFRILCPEIEIITPIRDKALQRDEEIAYLQQHGVAGDWEKAAYSINQGLWGTTIGGRETLTSHLPLPAHAWPSEQVVAEREPRSLTLSFEKGIPGALDGEPLPPVELLRRLNALGASFRLGRGMHVGDTILGIKGRVAYEAPAALLTIAAHHALEKHTLSKWQLQLKDQLALWYGQLLHEGQFLDESMRSIEAFFADAQRFVTGTVHMNLQPYGFEVLGVDSPYDLMASRVATYGEENRAWTGADARGFATISAIASSIARSKHA
jgi:argininosuccinate synthase